MNKNVLNWIELAEYDFETAKHMLNSGRYLYVIFTCQQCIEKLLKAKILLDSDTNPPFIHNLLKLSSLANFQELISEESEELLSTLDFYYIQGRYSSEIIKLKNSLTPQFTKEIFESTYELKKWLISKII